MNNFFYEFSESWCEWIYSINPFDLILSALLGALMGFLISYFYSKLTEKNRKRKLENIYKPIEGSFFRYDNNKTKLHAKAKITYNYDNRLTIEVTTFIHNRTGEEFSEHKIQKWIGDLSMFSERSGTILWHYIQPENLVGKTGFKRFIINVQKNEITLVGEQDQGYGNEKFQREI